MKGTTNIPIVSIIFRKDGKFLFVLRANTGYRDGFYGLPGGHVEPGENFRQAACREALEEVGATVGLDDLNFKAIIQSTRPAPEPDSGDIRVGVFFEATAWDGELHNAEPTVHSEIAWLDPGALPENIIPRDREAVRMITTGQAYTEFGWPA